MAHVSKIGVAKQRLKSYRWLFDIIRQATLSAPHLQHGDYNTQSTIQSRSSTGAAVPAPADDVTNML